MKLLIPLLKSWATWVFSVEIMKGVNTRTIKGPNPQITVHSPTVDFYPFLEPRKISMLMTIHSLFKKNEILYFSFHSKLVLTDCGNVESLV